MEGSPFIRFHEYFGALSRLAQRSGPSGIDGATMCNNLIRTAMREAATPGKGTRLCCLIKNGWRVLFGHKMCVAQWSSFRSFTVFGVGFSSLRSEGNRALSVRFYTTGIFCPRGISRQPLDVAAGSSLCLLRKCGSVCLVR